MNKFTELFLNEEEHENLPLQSIQYTPHSQNYSSQGPANQNDLLKEILKNTNEIKESLKDLNTRIRCLEEENRRKHTRQLTELTVTQKMVVPKPKSAYLKAPMKSVEEFEKFEDEIKNSHELSEKIEEEIYNFQGSDASKFVRFMWRKILNDDVASSYSWKGTKDKKSIDVMAITAAFRGAFNRKFSGLDREFNRSSVK